MAIKEVTPQQAHDILTNDPSAVYIDVRTEGEFANGHPQGAVNIPVAFSDPERGMIVNSDFIRVVEANFQREKRIILGCQAGPRSTSAANMLQQVGFKMSLICWAASPACGIQPEKSALRAGRVPACRSVTIAERA
jgi:rhodanese-related sulfurtransferase